MLAVCLTIGMNKFGQSSRNREAYSAGVLRSSLLSALTTMEFNDDGSIGAKNQRLCNLLAPIDPADAVNKQYLELQLLDIKTILNSLIDRVNNLMRPS